MNWTEITSGDITMKHHSMSSVIEIILEEEGHHQIMMLDYFQFNYLLNAIRQMPQHYIQKDNDE